MFNLGGFVGGIVLFAMNFDNISHNLSYGTYVVLAVCMCVGSLIGFAFIGSPKHVVREDGVPVPYLRSEVSLLSCMHFWIVP